VGCNEDTWVCLTDSEVDEHGKFWSTPLIQKGDATLIIESSNLDHDPSQLQIKVHSAKKDLDVVFTCSEFEKVELINTHYDTLRFMWASRHGCHLTGKSSTRRRRSESSLSEEQDPNGSDDSHEGDDDSELLPNDSRKARTGIALVLAFIVLSVFGGAALASSARARHFVVEAFRNASYAVVPALAEVGLKLRPLGRSLNSLTSKAMLDARFRPGDDNLVRWAQEDMALDSDIMVNGSSGSGAYQLDEESQWDGSNEYIPLARSPRFGTGRRVQSYGSTPEVATFQERGVMSRMRKYLKM